MRKNVGGKIANKIECNPLRASFSGKAEKREKKKIERAAKRKALWLAIKPWEIFVDKIEAPPFSVPVLVSFDLERAGYVEHDIIEIGAIKVDLNRYTMQKFHVLVKPQTHLNRYVEKLTGITLAELQEQRSLPEVLPDFLRFVGNAVVIGHAIGDNDLVQINLALRRHKLPEFPAFFPRFIDTEHVAHRLLEKSNPPVKKYGLSFLLAHYGMELPAKHRALEDAIASYILLYLMMTDERGENISSAFWQRQEALVAKLKNDCQMWERNSSV